MNCFSITFIGPRTYFQGPLPMRAKLTRMLAYLRVALGAIAIEFRLGTDR